MIVSKPYGGISNRIKCLLSSMDIDEDIKLVWDHSLYDGGVWCKFSDLFENDYEEFFSQDECLKKYPNTNIYTECKFFGNNTYNHLDLLHGDNWWKFIDENTKQRYRALISKLIPKQYVKEKIEYFLISICFFFFEKNHSFFPTNEIIKAKISFCNKQNFTF